MPVTHLIKVNYRLNISKVPNENLMKFNIYVNISTLPIRTLMKFKYMIMLNCYKQLLSISTIQVGKKQMNRDNPNSTVVNSFTERILQWTDGKTDVCPLYCPDP